VTGPTFGNKASGAKPKLLTPAQAALGRDLMAGAKDRTAGPLICRLCKDIGQHVQVRNRNIEGTGFRAFPCCADRQECRERREMQGKTWPLVDASHPTIFAPASESDPEDRMWIPTSMMIPVTLDGKESRETHAHADAVWKWDIEHGYVGKFDPGSDETEQIVNLRGFGAEMAAHKALGIPLRWEMHEAGYRQSMKTADLRARTDVKNPRYRRYRLWCDEGDKTYRRFDWSFLKVSGEMPTYLIEGWAYGYEIMIDEYWVERGMVRPAFFLPNNKLRPLPLPPEGS
jgi:hypothetical protein